MSVLPRYRPVFCQAVANATADIGKVTGNLGQDAQKAVDQDVNKISRGIGGLLKKSTN